MNNVLTVISTDEKNGPAAGGRGGSACNKMRFFSFADGKFEGQDRAQFLSDSGENCCKSELLIIARNRAERVRCRVRRIKTKNCG